MTDEKETKEVSAKAATLPPHVRGAFYPINLLSHDDDPDWKVVRYPFTDAGTEVIGVMQPGYLVKFNANRNAVLPALAADDATLEGIIVGLPDPEDDPANPTVAVALNGSFNQRQIHYADAHLAAYPTPPPPLSAAAVARLRDMNIFLDQTVPGQPFAP